MQLVCRTGDRMFRVRFCGAGNAEHFLGEANFRPGGGVGDDDDLDSWLGGDAGCARAGGIAVNAYVAGDARVAVVDDWGADDDAAAVTGAGFALRAVTVARQDFQAVKLLAPRPQAGSDLMDLLQLLLLLCACAVLRRPAAQIHSLPSDHLTLEWWSFRHRLLLTFRLLFCLA